MPLWAICRVRLGGHVTKTEGYDIKTPPLLLCGSSSPSEGRGSEDEPAAPRAQPPSAGRRPTGKGERRKRSKTADRRRGPPASAHRCRRE